MSDQSTLQSLLAAISEFGQTTGDYWSKSNAEFAKKDPNIIEKTIRGLNPMTGLGSALGQMHDAAGEGDKLAMALSAFGALPAFGGAKSALPVAGEAAGKFANTAAGKFLKSSIGKTLKNEASNAATNMIVDDMEERR